LRPLSSVTNRIMALFSFKRRHRRITIGGETTVA
jgi:hypothetical protein